MKLRATGLRADESEVHRVFSKAVRLLAEEFLQGLRLEIGSECEPHQLALNALTGGLEQLFSEIGVQDAG